MKRAEIVSRLEGIERKIKLMYYGDALHMVQDLLNTLANWENCDRCDGKDEYCGKCRGLGLQRRVDELDEEEREFLIADRKLGDPKP